MTSSTFPKPSAPSTFPSLPVQHPQPPMVLQWESTGPSSQSNFSGLNFHADHHTALHWYSTGQSRLYRPSSASGLNIHQHCMTPSSRAAAPSAPLLSARPGSALVLVPSAQIAKLSTAASAPRTPRETAPRATPPLLPQAEDSRRSCDKLLAGIEDMRRMGAASTPELDALEMYLQRMCSY